MNTTPERAIGAVIIANLIVGFVLSDLIACYYMGFDLDFDVTNPRTETYNTYIMLVATLGAAGLYGYAYMAQVAGSKSAPTQVQ